jgi:DeoR family transcriptional regulator, aga operon transcriptional repressor
MLSEERKRAILETLDRDGRVLVVDLAKHFQISAVTIRKDLGVLHAKGRIQRTHGGAFIGNFWVDLVRASGRCGYSNR